MAFDIYLKKEIKNELNIEQKQTVQNITVADGCLIVGGHNVPLSNILYFKEVN